MVMLKGKKHKNSDAPGGREDRQEADPASQVRRDRSECLNGGAQVGAAAGAGPTGLRAIGYGYEAGRPELLLNADQNHAADMPIALHRVRGRLRRLAAGLRYCLALAVTCGVVRQIRQWSMRWRGNGMVSVYGLSETRGILRRHRGRMQTPGTPDQEDQDQIEDPALMHESIIGQDGNCRCERGLLRGTRRTLDLAHSCHHPNENAQPRTVRR